MTTISFKQTPPAHLFAPLFNILAFLTPVYFFTQSVVSFSQTANSTSLLMGLIFVSYVIMLAIALLITANYFCEIAVEETGVSVSFLWRKLHLDWRDIIEIKAIRYFGRSHSWVVLTKQLTSFHRLYGVIYGFSWLPSFIISPTLRDGEKLARIIEERVKGDLRK